MIARSNSFVGAAYETWVACGPVSYVESDVSGGYHGCEVGRRAGYELKRGKGKQVSCVSQFLVLR